MSASCDGGDLGWLVPVFSRPPDSAAAPAPGEPDPLRAAGRWPAVAAYAGGIISVALGRRQRDPAAARRRDAVIEKTSAVSSGPVLAVEDRSRSEEEIF